MGSGLILAGIGKGIADASATYGNAMFKMAEAEHADQRALQRQEALDEIKRQRVIRDSAAAETEATRIGEARTEKQLSTDASKIAGVASQVKGDSPAMSAEEIQQLIKDNPQYAETYRKSGLIDKAMTPSQQRIQAADDRVQGAMNIGASATVIEAFQKQRKDVLDQIREENKEARDLRRDDLAAEREARRDREFAALLPIRQQQADNGTTRANKPSGKSDTGDKPPTGIDLERNAKAAKQALALELGVTDKDVAEKVAQLKKKGGITPAIQEKLDSYNGALSNWQNYKSNKPSANRSSDNADNRPALDSFRR